MSFSRYRIIVAGGGQTGLNLSKALVSRGHQVVIVERDSDRCDILNEHYIATVIEGDATDPTVLAQTEPTTADALVAVTNSPTTNLVICRIACKLGIPVAVAVDDGKIGEAKMGGIRIIEYDDEIWSFITTILNLISE